MEWIYFQGVKWNRNGQQPLAYLVKSYFVFFTNSKLHCCCTILLLFWLLFQAMFDATLKERKNSFHLAPGTSMFVHWLVGMVYVFYFASFILLLREVLRPGLLWFLRNLNDPEFNPIQEVISLYLSFIFFLQPQYDNYWFDVMFIKLNFGELDLNLEWSNGYLEPCMKVSIDALAHLAIGNKCQRFLGKLFATFSGLEQGEICFSST